MGDVLNMQRSAKLIREAREEVMLISDYRWDEATQSHVLEKKTYFPGGLDDMEI